MFVVSEYSNSPLILFECEKKTIWTLIVEEMYYGLIFLHANIYKTIQDELTAYLIARVNLIVYILNWDEILKDALERKVL